MYSPIERHYLLTDFEYAGREGENMAEVLTKKNINIPYPDDVKGNANAKYSTAIDCYLVAELIEKYRKYREKTTTKILSNQLKALYDSIRGKYIAGKLTAFSLIRLIEDTMKK